MRALLTTAAVAAVAWLGNGAYVYHAVDDPWITVNPLTHTITQVSDEQYEPATMGHLIGARLAAPLCEAAARDMPGFGWRVTITTIKREPVISCWSWS